MNSRPSQTAELDREVNELGTLLGRLIVRARIDQEDAVGPSVSLDPPVSGGGGTSPTEAGLDALSRARDYRRIVGAIGKAVRMLQACETDITPQATGEQCPTAARNKNGVLIQCEGQVTHRGRCWRCHDYLRNSSVPPDAQLLKDWNSRLPQECQCGPGCCPDGCLDMVPAGSGQFSGRCRTRKWRQSA